MALQHLRSNTANKRPDPTAMADGQLAINTPAVSPGLFFKDAAGVLVKVGPVHVGTTAPNASPASGGTAGNSVGEQWLDTTGGTYVFKVWDGSAWRSESGTFVDVNGDVMTGALGIIAGSAGSPGLYFSGDTNTGIYSPGADQVAISTAGSGRLFVDAGGNVSVGTTSTAGFGRSISVNGISYSSYDLYADGTIYGRVRAYLNEMALLAQGASSYLTLGTNNTERLRITSAGLVGVGTSSPGATLDITGSTYPNFLANRSLSSGGSGAAAWTAARVQATTTEQMSAGFGVQQEFALRDADAVDNTVASILVSRDGADNSGSFAIRTASAGTLGTRLHVTSGGNVGIGTTSPVVSGLTIESASSTQGIELSTDTGFASGPTIRGYYRSGSSYRQLGITGSQVIFGIQDVEKARLDASGRLLVGTSTARRAGAAFGPYTPTIQVEALGANGQQVYTGILNRADNLGPEVVLAKTRGEANGASTIVQSNDFLGSFVFAGADGTDIESIGARIDAFVDGTPGANDMPGRLVFSTTQDGTSSPIERLRIASNGIFYFNSAGAGTAAYNYQYNGTSIVGASFLDTSNTGTTAAVRFFRNTSTQVGEIATSTTGTAYNSSSDYRLKENIVAISDGIARLQKLKPSQFNFIADPENTIDGFIAHEVQEVVPLAVTGEKDAQDSDGNPIYQGIDQSKLVPLLTAALQEAVAEIRALKDRVTALEGA